MRSLFLLLLMIPLHAEPKHTLEYEISQLLVLGFNGTALNTKATVSEDIKQGLGGVILFDPNERIKDNFVNVSNPKQLTQLNLDLQSLTKEPLLICIDQEGGTVRRLKEKQGFKPLPSAALVGAKDEIAYSQQIYQGLADELSQLQINCVFAPVVDLAIEPKNPIIYQRERAFSHNPKIVVKHAALFIEAMRRKHIFSIIKHFPGHGSSLSDSHKGFVDVSESWKEIELEPFAQLIKMDKVDMIMSAHIFNKYLDPKYPATMSYQTNTKLLRNKLGFQGLMISDGLQMHAISKNFKLKEVVEKTLNSGVDMLLFANQLGFNSREEIVKSVLELVDEGKISEQSIRDKANRIRIYKKKVLAY